MNFQQYYYQLGYELEKTAATRYGKEVAKELGGTPKSLSTGSAFSGGWRSGLYEGTMEGARDKKGWLLGEGPYAPTKQEVNSKGQLTGSIAKSKKLRKKIGAPDIKSGEGLLKKILGAAKKLKGK